MVTLGKLRVRDFEKVGEFLEAWRLSRKDTPRYKKKVDIGRITGINSSVFSKLEGGDLEDAFKGWRPKKQYDVFKAYDVPDELIIELSDKFGLDAKLMVGYSASPTPSKKGLGELGDLVSIPFLGIVQAGRLGTSYAADEVEYIEMPRRFINGYDPQHLFMVEVSGDSMSCESVKQKIPEGSYVLFEKVRKNVQPKDGEVVSVWLANEDIGVIKVFHKQDSFAVLQSYNLAHKPIIVNSDNPGWIQGIYRGHFYLAPDGFDI